jgi:hypothetical protein
MDSVVRDRFLSKFNHQLNEIASLNIPDTMPIPGIEVAPRYKCVYDLKNKSYVWYDDQPHLYFSYYTNGIKLPMISVTTLIHAYSTPFDPMMASRCANKEGYTTNCLDTANWDTITHEMRTNRIKVAWEQNSKIASDYGTFAHAVMESLTLDSKGDIDEVYRNMSLRYNQDYTVVKEFAREYLTILNLLEINGCQIIAEPLVYDLDILVAGQSDVVAIDHKSKKIFILDFKTNKVRPDLAKSYSRMEGSLGHLENVAYVHYCIQLCLYQRMVQTLLPGYSLGVNTLLWLNRETGEIEKLYINPSDWETTMEVLYRELNSLKIDIFNMYDVNKYFTP